MTERSITLDRKQIKKNAKSSLSLLRKLKASNVNRTAVIPSAYPRQTTGFRQDKEVFRMRDSTVSVQNQK